MKTKETEILLLREEKEILEREVAHLRKWIIVHFIILALIVFFHCVGYLVKPV